MNTHYLRITNRKVLQLLALLARQWINSVRGQLKDISKFQHCSQNLTF